MIDISAKSETLREATASVIIITKPAIITRVIEKTIPKGDVESFARAASILGAKRTTDLIPLCHPISIDWVKVDFSYKNDRIELQVTVKGIAKTGVEMEALTACALGALTVYDMLKPLDKEILITDLKLLEKKGGKSDFSEEFKEPLKSAVLVLSDSCFKGTKEDESGKIIVERLKTEGCNVLEYKILPDDYEIIRKELLRLCDEVKVDLVITTGGTGFGPSDRTPEATKSVIEKEAAGISETIRAYGQKRTPRSMLSRGVSGIRGKTLIINLPGSRQGASEGMAALFPGILHAFPMLFGGGH